MGSCGVLSRSDKGGWCSRGPCTRPTRMQQAENPEALDGAALLEGQAWLAELSTQH